MVESWNFRHTQIQACAQLQDQAYLIYMDAHVQSRACSYNQEKW